MTLIWLLLGLPCVAALAVIATRPPLATAIARATTAITALLATMFALGAPLGAAAALPWIPERGLRLAFALDPLAIPGILTVAWLSALVSAHQRGRQLSLLLIGEAAAMAAWLADDLVTMVAAWSLLAILAAAMVGRSRQSMMPVFLPLSAAAAALTVTALGLALGHHEATVGAWSFALSDSLEILAPASAEAILAGSSLVAAWLIAGIWPLHGWWRLAAEVAPPAFAAWLPAVLRPLGVGLLIRVTLSAAPASLALLAPILAIAGGVSILAGLLGMASQRSRRRWHLHLAHLPVGVALIGVSTLTPEGLSGALLLGLGGGLAFALAHLGSRGARTPARRMGRTVGHLGLLGAPGLLGFAGALPIGLATLSQGSWLVPWPLLAGLLVLCAPFFAVPRVIAAARAVTSAAQPASTQRRPAIRSLALGSAVLILLGLLPGLVQDRVTAVAPAKLHRIYERWCTVALSPLQRARRMTVPAEGCERGMATLRARQEAAPLAVTAESSASDDPALSTQVEETEETTPAQEEASLRAPAASPEQVTAGQDGAEPPPPPDLPLSPPVSAGLDGVEPPSPPDLPLSPTVSAGRDGAEPPSPPISAGQEGAEPPSPPDLPLPPPVSAGRDGVEPPSPPDLPLPPPVSPQEGGAP